MIAEESPDNQKSVFCHRLSRGNFASSKKCRLSDENDKDNSEYGTCGIFPDGLPLRADDLFRSQSLSGRNACVCIVGVIIILYICKKTDLCTI